MSKVVKVVEVKHNQVGTSEAGKQYTYTAIDYETGDGEKKSQKIWSNLLANDQKLASVVNSLKSNDTIKLEYTQLPGKKFRDLSSVSFTTEPLTSQAAYKGGFSGKPFTPNDGTAAQVGGLMHDAVALVVGGKKQDLKTTLFELIDLSEEAKAYAKGKGGTTVVQAAVAPQPTPQMKPATKEVVVDDDVDWN